jgi:hypothetical protein
MVALATEMAGIAGGRNPSAALVARGETTMMTMTAMTAMTAMTTMTGAPPPPGVAQRRGGHPSAVRAEVAAPVPGVGHRAAAPDP